MSKEKISKEKPTTKTCKYCKTEIPCDAKICPNCRKKQKGSGCLVAVGIVIAIILLISCFGRGSEDSADAKKELREETGAAEAGSEALGQELNKSDEQAAKEQTKAEETSGIEEQVLLEWEGLKVTAKELVSDAVWGEGVKVLIENDSEQNLGVNCQALIVNDYMISNLFSETVEAGKKSNATIYLLSSELEAAGIEHIGQIEVYFHVFNGDSYEGLYDADGAVIQTAEYDQMDDSELEEEGKELLNQDGIRIVGKYVDENSFWGKALLLYVENSSGKNVTISCDDMSVNGFMVSPLFSSTVYDGKKSFDDITLFSSDLEENGIEEIKDIELKFRVYEADSFQTLFESDEISFSVE